MASVFHLGRIAVTHLGRCTASKVLQNHSRFFRTAHNVNYSFHPVTVEEKNNLTEAVPFVAEKEFALEEILSSSEKISLSAFEAVNILGTLNKFNEEEDKLEKLKTDTRFLNLCEVVGKGCHQLSSAVLISALRNFLELGVPPESSSMQFVENEVLWKARKMNFKLLCICLKFHLPYQETQRQKTVVQHLCEVIQMRWCEIADVTDVIKLIQLGKCFHENFLTKLEDRCLELTEKMTSVEIYKVLCALTQLNRRPTPLLRAISFHLKRRSEKLTVKQMTDVLFALNALSFPDSVILQQITENLLLELKCIEKENVMFSILTSMGQLQWRHIELLETCGEWILKHIESCQSQVLVAYILALARLNYIPEEADSIFNQVVPRLTRINIHTDTLWLDVVWSLAILERITKEHLFTVLHSQFYSPLIGNDNFESIICKMKLLNLNAVARTYFPSVPCLPFEPALDIQIPRSENAQKQSKSVLDALRNFIPEGKYMKSSLSTPLGIFIDAEFIVDRKGKPVPLTEYGLQAGNKNILKSLPENLFRVALLVWNYKDLTLNSQSLVGSKSHSVRLLKKLGYTVVEVPYTEYSDISTTVKKVNYLQEKINQCVLSSQVAGQFPQN